MSLLDRARDDDQSVQDAQYGPAEPVMGHAGARLGMVELLDRDGAVTHRIAVHRWPMTIGRSIDCDVVLDDPHTAAEHAVLTEGGTRTVDGTGGPGPGLIAQLRVSDTRNGVRVGRMLVAAGSSVAIPSGTEWQIGRSRMRLRLAGETLPPELPMALPVSTRGPWIVAGVVLLLAWVLGERWLQSDPGDPLGNYLPALVGVPVALGVWCFVWALGSKLFARHFDFLAHLRLALSVLLASLTLEALLPLAGFALSWEWLPRTIDLLGLALGSALIHGHLSLILPARRRALAVGFATLFVVGAGLKLALNEQREDRWFTPLYMSTLGPPMLRMAPTVPPERFITEARRLKAPLDARAREPDSGPWLTQDSDD